MVVYKAAFLLKSRISLPEFNKKCNVEKSQ